MPAPIRLLRAVVKAKLQQYYTHVSTPGVTKLSTQRERCFITVECAAKATGGVMPGETELFIRKLCLIRL